MTDPAPLLAIADGPPVEVLHASGTAPVLLVCEHASPVIPSRLGNLGLSPQDRLTHAVWDPGAFDLALALSERLDAPLVAGRFSRLVYDCNRPPEAPGAIPAQSERVTVPGNAALSPHDRAARAAAIHAPFHTALAQQIAHMNSPAVVTIHSFTPVWHGQPRDLHLGVLFTPRDDRLARAMLSAPGLPEQTRANAPYGPGDGVMHTLERHALPQTLLHAMLEVRNDLLTTPADVARMADTLARAITHAMARFPQIVQTHP